MIGPLPQFPPSSWNDLHHSRSPRLTPLVVCGSIPPQPEPDLPPTSTETSYDAIVLFGVVKDTNDPDGLGRVQCELVGFGEQVVLPWIRVMQATASNAFGHFFLPEVDDEVVILRGAGNEPAGMIVLGCMYHGKNKPGVKEDGKNNTKEIFTRGGNRILLYDEDGKESVHIHTKEEKVTVLMEAADGKLTGKAEKVIDWTTEDYTLTSKNTVTIDCSKGEVSVKADKCNVEATEVSVKGKSKVEVQGAQVTVKGDSKVAIEAGGTGEFKASGPLTLKGATVSIG